MATQSRPIPEAIKIFLDMLALVHREVGRARSGKKLTSDHSVILLEWLLSWGNMPHATPTVVIVGRPNVGKSTLFNRITGQRRAIVGDEPGITRDRIHGQAEHQGRHFELIDTGGIVVEDHEYIPAQILHQAEVALRKAAHIIFLVDGRAEITGSDRDLARMLKKLGKPVSLAVNKVDTVEKEGLANEFYGLGIADVFPVSSEHGTGVYALLDRVTAGFPTGEVAATPSNENVPEG